MSFPENITSFRWPEGPGDVKERVRSHVMVDVNSGCWLWMATIAPNGYGMVKVLGKQRGAHRASYEAFIGLIPTDYEIDHKCRVRCCVNPNHLEAVPHLVNILRAVPFSKNHQRNKTHCKYGHEFTVENTRYVKLGRACRKCGGVRTAAERERKFQVL